MNKKLKILYVSHSPYYNGAEICLLTLVKNINRNLFEPIIVFPYSGPLLEEMKNLGIKTYIFPLERWIRYKFEKPVKNSDINSRSQKIEKIIEEESIDIVHSNSSVVIEGAIAAKKKNIPHIWHIHEFLKDHPELHPCLPLPLIYKIISTLSEKIVCVSDFTKKQFIPIVDEEKLITIYNGVEGNKGYSELLRENLGIANDEIIAVTVGMLTERKGYPNLLESVVVVKKNGCKVKFLWVGESSKETLLIYNAKIKELGIKDSVIYLGFRKDISDILINSDLYICSSVNEAFPLVVLEAMSEGLPVISTNWGGASECVVDKETGFIVPVNDPVKLGEKIIELCTNEEKRKLFGEKGLKHFKKNFNANVYAEKFEKLYMQIINNRDSVPTSIKDKMLIDSFMQIYQLISDNHWKVLKKGKLF